MNDAVVNTRTKILDATWKLLEETQGLGVRMIDIAKKVKISRQAVYLHFANRTELMIATIQYVDEKKGLNKRLKKLKEAQSGEEMLARGVEAWGNYIPEIFGIAKGLLQTKEIDEATAAAWEGIMKCLKEVCKNIVETLSTEGKLSEDWSIETGAEIFYSIISIQVWEQLVVEAKFSQKDYISLIKTSVRRVLIQ